MEDVRISHPVPRRAQRIAWVFLALVLVGLGLWTLKEFLGALVWAGVLAVIFWPSYQTIRRRWPLGRSTILLPLLFTLGLNRVGQAAVIVARSLRAGIPFAPEKDGRTFLGGSSGGHHRDASGRY